MVHVESTILKILNLKLLLNLELLLLNSFLIKLPYSKQINLLEFLEDDQSFFFLRLTRGPPKRATFTDFRFFAFFGRTCATVRDPAL